MGKTLRKEFRLTEREAKELAARSAEEGIKESEYIRQRLKQKPLDYSAVRKLLDELINEVNHIGVNINQIVKNANSGFYRATDKEKLMAYMKKIREEVNGLVGKIDGP